MHQEVFKSSLFKAIILPILLTVGLFCFYYYLISEPDYTPSMINPDYTPSFPLWTLLFLILPVIMFVEGQSKKLIVEGEILRYKRVFPIKRDDRVSLHDVHGFKVNYERDQANDTTTKVIQIINQEGDLLFTIPGSLLRPDNANRFKAAVHAVNPDIKIY